MTLAGDCQQVASQGFPRQNAEYVRGPLLANTAAVGTNAAKLTAEYMRLFVLEASHRAAATAQAEGSVKVDAEHLEKILPQLVSPCKVWSAYPAAA
jgi:hypothetical protein